MKLERVTITGADDKIRPSELIEISKKYPFVEWGILFSPSRTGQPRYPSEDWVKELKKQVYLPIKFSAHLCGEYTKEIVETGDNKLIKGNSHFKSVGSLFQRVQLNFNASRLKVCEGFYSFIQDKSEEFNFIIQSNSANSEVCSTIMANNIPVDFLWDSSGGRGVVNNSWTAPFSNHFTGYAGGLNPDNLKDNLDKLFSFNSDTDIWIDTETGVRTNDEFDLGKVVRFLDIAAPYHYRSTQDK